MNKALAAVKKFEAVQIKYASQGASDSEPNGVFRCIVMNAVKGGDFDILTGRTWELYSGDKKKQAERALTAAAKKVHDAIQKATIAEVKEACEQAWVNYDDCTW
jgi:hypothetical protein